MSCHAWRAATAGPDWVSYLHVTLASRGGLFGAPYATSRGMQSSAGPARQGPCSVAAVRKGCEGAPETTLTGLPWVPALCSCGQPSAEQGVCGAARHAVQTRMGRSFCRTCCAAASVRGWRRWSAARHGVLRSHGTVALRSTQSQV